MAGSRSGGLRTARVNRLRHGADFYQRIGAMGGKIGKGGGFTGDSARARIAGAKGGQTRTKNMTTIKYSGIEKYLDLLKEQHNGHGFKDFYDACLLALPALEMADMFSVRDGTIYAWKKALRKKLDGTEEISVHS